VPARRRAGRSPAAYPRTARVNEVLREVVADALERMADADDRLRLVTVTAVATTPDLSRATVYLSSLSDETRQALAADRPQLQGAIARQVRMKRTPQLVFEADPGVAHGQRVEEILRRLHAGGSPAPGGPSEEPDGDGGG